MTKTFHLIVLGLLAVLISAVKDANALTADLNPAKDNTLFEDFNGLLSSGAGPGLYAGVTNNGLIRRGLLMFDIAAELPSNATITDASLTLEVTNVANSSFVDSIQLRRLAADWGESGSDSTLDGDGGGDGTFAESGDATWTRSFSPNTAWSNFGGDFVNEVSAATGVSGVGSYTWSSQQLVDDVKDMLIDPNINFGWILLGVESVDGTAKRYESRESSNPPVLSIEYSLPNSGPDFDGDGDVDGDDLGDWADAYGSGDGGDADGDNDSDGTDFLTWQQQFTGPAGLRTSVVPEPSTFFLSSVLVAAGALNRRRPLLRCATARK